MVVSEVVAMSQLISGARTRPAMGIDRGGTNAQGFNIEAKLKLIFKSWELEMWLAVVVDSK